MAPTNSKTNFKSFDVQARLLRAIVAAHPDVKWNYKGKPFLSSMLSARPFSFHLGPHHSSPGASELASSTSHTAACILPGHADSDAPAPEIRNCYGSDLTDNIMGHRMRHIRTQAAIIRKGLEAGLDPKNMPAADHFFPKDQNKIDSGTRLVPATGFSLKAFSLSARQARSRTSTCR